ncbi:MAG TPA: VOC family protein [Steroidobacteraceae bacterium]|nr:VOC family protein [Steroidobacteraceae bacterium]
MTMQVSAITAFRLTTSDARRLARFYEEFGFAVQPPEPIAGEEMALLGLEGRGYRVTLRLGGQRIDLDSFDVPGRPYPSDATAADVRFQHFAIVTDDAAVAWKRAKALGAVPISSGGPVRLPPATGVAAAIKFRDPEGHPLELLQLLPEQARPWSGTHLLGIDHSAISVSDIGASRRFYEALGLSVSDPTLNEGPTQMALDGLPEAEVDVVPMLPQQDTPHLELLGYRRPRPVGHAADGLRPNDVAATRIVWAADRDELIRDPDGHLHLLTRRERR